MEFGEKRKMFFLLLMIGRSSGGVNAASEHVQNRQQKMEVSLRNLNDGKQFVRVFILMYARLFAS